MRYRAKAKQIERNPPPIWAERVPKVYGVYKGAWGMPRLSEAKKDVISCEKPR